MCVSEERTGGLLTNDPLNLSIVFLVSDVVGVRGDNPPAGTGVHGCVLDFALVFALVDVSKVKASGGFTLQRDGKQGLGQVILDVVKPAGLPIGSH